MKRRIWPQDFKMRARKSFIDQRLRWRSCLFVLASWDTTISCDWDVSSDFMTTSFCSSEYSNCLTIFSLDSMSPVVVSSAEGANLCGTNPILIPGFSVCVPTHFNLQDMTVLLPSFHSCRPTPVSSVEVDASRTPASVLSAVPFGIRVSSLTKLTVLFPPRQIPFRKDSALSPDFTFRT